jgi:anti-sigma B factor antagonist
MNVETLKQGDSLILLTDGRVDGTNAVEFQNSLENAIEGNDQPVILDFEKLSYISSAGLRAILVVTKALQRQNVKFAVCSLIDPVKEVFVISGFNRIIPVHESQESAMSSFGS